VRTHFLFSVLTSFVASWIAVQAHGTPPPQKHVASIDELLTLKSAGGAQVSPDGKWVAYTVSHGDFKQDLFVTQIWLADAATGRRFPLTHSEKSSTDPRWSPDGRWIAFLSNRTDGKNQLYLIRPDGGEAFAISKSETDIARFVWSEDSRTIAYAATEPVPQPAKDRKDYLGDFEVTRKDYRHVHLWTIDIADAFDGPVAGKQRTKGQAFSVDGFSFSPDSRTLAFSATVNPDLTQLGSADIYLLNLANDEVTPLVRQAGPDRTPYFSPDGQSIAFVSSMGREPFFARNLRIAVVPVTGGKPRSISDAFDEQPNLIGWKADGVYFYALQKTASHLFRIDPAKLSITRISQPNDLMVTGDGFSLSPDGRHTAFTVVSPQTLGEIHVSAVAPFAPRGLTDMTAQTRDFIMATREVISWKSRDGTTIEGVLIKPADFDPSKKYPLLCILHGGPTGIDRPTLLDTRYYPADIWAAKGALLLKVNYRGSAGYGEAFRMLNIRNLGVGDAWDVLSGIDHLAAKGWVDTRKVASMGWSQGGYISAFLTASSDRFAAISVGAGISDWATYYYNTDITPFTIQYLGANPVDDPAIYQKTSPIAYIKSARTPTLIQHGELDRRVPIANAYELRQALEDRGVKTEMIVYKGYGHGITKPKSLRAVMAHNVQWFNHNLWGDPLPDFTQPAVPKKEEKDKTGSAADSAGPTTTRPN
jgi:dipeptidyl aminopeptidase/acylaminoacyl peptidase